VTGLCECTSLAGPLLGGGHSFLQGQYGYAVDGLVSARVVLANGNVVTASRTQNADLFWALQGAGHNFGILASLQVKVHDIPSKWTVYSFVFLHDKLEALYSLVNEFEEPSSKRPAKLAMTGAILRLPDVDPNNVSFT
jgi:FAD/FMN-containing dehydrogenase